MIDKLEFIIALAREGSIVLDGSLAHERAIAVQVFSRGDQRDLAASWPIEATSISSIRVNFSLGLPFSLPREISAVSSIDQF